MVEQEGLRLTACKIVFDPLWLSRKACGNRPKSCHVQTKARELYLTYGYSDMKCSYGWFKRWSQRFQIQLRYQFFKMDMSSQEHSELLGTFSAPPAE